MMPSSQKYITGSRCPLNMSIHPKSIDRSDRILYKSKVKSCYNPLRLGTLIVLVSSGIDFVNTPRLYSDRATR